MKSVMDHGQIKKVADNFHADYRFISPSDFFSPASNLIPALSGVSGGRVLLGDKAQAQSMSLIHRESPLVEPTPNKKGDSWIKSLGNKLLAVESTKAGTVLSVTPHNIVIKDENGKTHAHDIYNNFQLGRKSFIHQTPNVEVGAKVKEGQVIATSNHTNKDGKLALGTNINTAILAWRGAGYEDAFVLSETGAKKLEAEQLVPIKFESRLGMEANKDKFISLFPNKFFNTQLTAIDSDGAVKVGTTLHHGDPVILAVAPRALRTSDIQLGNLSKTLKNAFRDCAVTWDYEHDGLVTDVVKSKDLISINVKTIRGMANADKLSVAFGNKGVVNIQPDSQMPTDKDGNPVDLILNSMSITSRVAPAVAISMALGKVAQKTGKPIQITPFTEHSSLQGTIDLLKKHGISETETLHDPNTGREIKAFMGPLFVQRLAHISEDKMSGRSQGVGYTADFQPGKTSEESAKRLGNLHTNALLSHNARAVLEDAGVIRSSKNDEYWRRLKLNLPLPAPEVPFVFNKFIASLQGAGINVHQAGNIYKILPSTDKDILKRSSGAVHNALTFKIKKDQMVPEAGGLFDPSITGVLGNQFNHIELHAPVPNPISEDYLRKLLNVTKKDYMDMIAKGTIQKRIESVNLDKEIAERVEYLKSGKKSERDQSVKVLAFLRTLKDNKLQPKDLMLTKVPVLPAQYRPVVVAGDLRLSADVNDLYKDLILNNVAAGNLGHVPAEVAEDIQKRQYNAVKAIYGLTEPITVKHKEKNLKGLLGTVIGIQGGSGKASFFQANVVNKPLDLVGRAAAVPDSKLGLDEVSVPQDLLWQIYSPFIIRRLIGRGVGAVQAKKFIETRNQIANEALQEELKHRPGIISRDPALHKYNLTGFFLKPNADPKDFSMKVNPLVCKSYNLDFDGDAINCSVPVGEKARLEVIEKMLPSRNLLSPRTFGPVYVPSNEAGLGLFLASTDKKTGAAKKYHTEEEVQRDFDNGKLAIDDLVEIS